MNSITTYPLIAVVSAIVGALIIKLLGRSSTPDTPAGADAARIRLETELAESRKRIVEWEQTHGAVQAQMAALQSKLTERESAVSSLQATLDAERRQTDDKLALLQSAREEMSNQFKVLASELLEEKSAKFVEVNQLSITQLLAPFQTDLLGLKERVDQVHMADSTDRAVLREQLRVMAEATGNLHTDATNLTKALKGDAKVQGDWGEMLLDRMLDSAGFVEDTHYTRQGSHTNEQGNRVIPDIVVHLPGERHIVVDSKVSLTAYVDLTASDNEVTRAAALKRHVESVYAHIKELSAKSYQELYKLASLDFVMMFIPNDGAFLQALAGDQELPTEAWKKNVLLVSPSTLLFSLRTIAHLWRQEEQSRNALEIADRGAKLYDKFVSFVDDLRDIGEQLDKARKAFDAAQSKLSVGSGNLVGQAEKLVKLGVKGRKALPRELLTEADGDEEKTAAPE